MNPPFSIIFLTTFIGMGQGLFWALYFGQVQNYCTSKMLSNLSFYFTGNLAVFFLLILGLIASVFHLGHPERAWRTAAMWRTSWLSREVIVLPMFMLFVFINLILLFLPDHRITYIFFVGGVGCLLSLALFICTSMIYACLRFVQEWHSSFTFINFTLMGAASGFILATLLATYYLPTTATFVYGVLALALTALAFISRNLSLRRNKKLRPKSTIQSALGVQGKIVQKSMGAMGGTFNTRAFFHGKKKIFLRSIKWIFLVLGFLLPMFFILTQLILGFNFVLMTVTLIMHYIGLVAERWYFFAEAKHPQNLYYQTIS